MTQRSATAPDMVGDEPGTGESMRDLTGRRYPTAVGWSRGQAPAKPAVLNMSEVVTKTPGRVAGVRRRHRRGGQQNVLGSAWTRPCRPASAAPEPGTGYGRLAAP